MGFQERVYRIVQGIPPGRVMSYSQVAKKAGSPRATRAVGTIMKKNPHPGAGPGNVPCHRVVRANGSLGGYSGPGGAAGKKNLLRKEGVVFKKGGVGKEFLISR